MINKLWIMKKDSWTKLNRAKDTIDEIRSLFSALKKEGYDLVVDLQGLLRSGIITSATGAAVRVGFKEAREGSRFFYTHKVAGGKGIHAVDRYLKIAEFLGCDTSNIVFPFPPASIPCGPGMSLSMIMLLSSRVRGGEQKGGFLSSLGNSHRCFL